MAFALSCQGGDGEAKPVGQILYETNCQSCHGGASGGRIDEIPPRHNANGHTWHHPDQQLIQIITGGYKVSDERGEMPAFGENHNAGDQTDSGVYQDLVAGRSAVVSSDCYRGVGGIAEGMEVTQS